jgi:hypothetical protein
VIGDPPSDAGAVHDTVAWVLPNTAVPMVGAPGICGVTVTESLRADGPPVPIELNACTENRYVVPSANPVTVSVVAVEKNVEGLWATPPTHGVTTYPTRALPPSKPGAVHDTVADPTPAVAVPIVGASGTVAGTTSFDGEDDPLGPSAFTATTVNV